MGATFSGLIHCCSCACTTARAHARREESPETKLQSSGAAAAVKRFNNSNHTLPQVLAHPPTSTLECAPLESRPHCRNKLALSTSKTKREINRPCDADTNLASKYSCRSKKQNKTRIYSVSVGPHSPLRWHCGSRQGWIRPRLIGVEERASYSPYRAGTAWVALFMLRVLFAGRFGSVHCPCA